MEPLHLTQPYRIGDWRVDPALDELSRGDQRVKVEPRLMRLLCCLAERPGEVIPAEELLDRVWTGVIVGPGSVYQAVAQLRRLLGDTDVPPHCIVTVPRKGYRLVAEVARDLPAQRAPPVDEKRREAATEAGALPADPVLPVAHTAVAAATRPAKRYWIYAAVAAAVVSVALVTTFGALRPAPEASVTPAVAVLPFVDLSADGSRQNFCAGLTEELRSSLARLPGVRVLGRGAVARFQGVGADIREIGRTLGATHVLEGAVRSNGRRVRVTAQLLHAPDGFQVWTGSYDRSAGDVILIQTQLARAVADTLALQLTPAARERVARAPLAQLNAYDLYLLGRHRQLGRSPADLGQAITYHSAALAADPGFALAHAGLADAYLAGYRRGVRTRPEALRLAQTEVDVALRQDPELAEAHVARGLLLIEQAQPEEALRALDRAIAIDSGASEAYLRRGLAQEHAGRPREALAAYDQVAALDPLHTDLYVRRCLVLASLGHHDAAERSCQRAFELQPGIPDALWARGLNAYARGDLVAAVNHYRSALKRAPYRGDFHRELAALYLDLGMNAEALAALRRAPARDAGPARSLAHGWWALTNGDRDSTQRIVVELSASDTAPDVRLDAASLALAAGLPRIAAAVVADTDRASVRAPDDLTAGPYRVLWGRCELCSLALLQQRTGDATAGNRSATAALVALTAMEAHGYRWHALHYRRAGLLAQQGHTPAALDALALAVSLGWRRAWLMRIDPAMDELRREPRFTTLLTRIDAANAHARAVLAGAVSPR